jgi:hypothetical protein
MFSVGMARKILKFAINKEGSSAIKNREIS